MRRNPPTSSTRDRTAVAAAPTRGRPRDVARDAAILDATVHAITELGYDQMSIEAVAARAGVAKTTIYRRYPDKASLAVAAIGQLEPAAPLVVRSEDLRGALVEVVRWLEREIAGQQVGLLGTLFAAMRSDPDLAEGIRRIRRRDEAAMVEASLERAIRHGEQVVPGAAELFAEIAPAVLVHRLIIGLPCDEAFLEHLVDDILLPVLQPG